ncbi:MAG: GyrI-like domain-containing protein [Candidatus Limimorpha sp.]
MAFDFKKEFKEYYLPAKKPHIIDVVPMTYIAVMGKGDPNIEDSDYKKSIQMLYSVAFTIKMSKMGTHRMRGYFDFVVPPLEGLWKHGDNENKAFGLFDGVKDNFCWTSIIRVPDFVSDEEFEWARDEASKKKKIDLSRVGLIRYDEGLCVQCMHIGPYDNEPATIEMMREFVDKQGYSFDCDGESRRFHHEIYISNPCKTIPERLKTVIRYPIVKKV